MCDILAQEFHLDIYYSLVASLSSLLIRSEVASLNHFGSRIKHSSVRIYGELVCKEFFRSFNNLWRLHCTCQQKLYKVRLLVVAIRVTCATEHLCCVAILNTFERAKTNHDKLLGENNSLMTRRQVALHIICINFQVTFCADNF